MKTQTRKAILRTSFCYLGIAAIAITTTFNPNSAFALSKEAAPAAKQQQLTTSSISGSWSSSQTETFDYWFQAGAGEMQITLNARSSSPGTQTVRLTLLDPETERRLESYFILAGPSGQNQRNTWTLRLPERRAYVIRISAENYSGRSMDGRFTVNLDEDYGGLLPQLNVPASDIELNIPRIPHDVFRFCGVNRGPGCPG